MREGMTRIGVVGAKGRMGVTICDAIRHADDLELVAEVDAGDNLKALVEANCEVAVDVTNVDAARENIPWLGLHGIHAVVGTTGFRDDDLALFSATFTAEGRSCLVVPNFSIGAVLLMRFSEQAAPYFDGVEIIELHHHEKRDAPSGTAALTATRIADARRESGDVPFVSDPTQRTTVDGVRGGVCDGVRLHSVRLPGLLAHQEVMFGSLGQMLTIRHDSVDRASFMPGVLRSIRHVGSLPVGLTIGLDAVL